MYEEGFYEECARMVDLIVKKEQSMKNLIYKSYIKDKRKLMALICKYFANLSEIEKIASHSQLICLQIDTHLIKVFLCEFLYGFKKSYLLLRKLHQLNLLSTFKEIKSQNQNLTNQDLQNEAQTLKYVRANCLKTTEDCIIKNLQDHGYTLCIMPNQSYQQNFQYLQNFYQDYTNRDKFFKDAEISNLYVFSPKAELFPLDISKQGYIVVQDKFSCIPAISLSPKNGQCLMDACASPGNKTSQLAALCQNDCFIYAVEKDANRVKVLRNRLELIGCLEKTEIITADFTELDPHNSKFSTVKYILVDPSCTGSGMVKRFETHKLIGATNHGGRFDGSQGDANRDRIERLSTFQCKILAHAFKFPAVERVVYSTCSVNIEENEKVIWDVYKQVKSDFYLASVMPKEFPTLRGYNYIAATTSDEAFDESNEISAQKQQLQAKRRANFFAKCLRTAVPRSYGRHLSRKQAKSWPHYRYTSQKNGKTQADNTDNNGNMDIANENWENFTIRENGFFVALFKRRRTKRALKKKH